MRRLVFDLWVDDSRVGDTGGVGTRGAGHHVVWEPAIEIKVTHRVLVLWILWKFSKNKNHEKLFPGFSIITIPNKGKRVCFSCFTTIKVGRFKVSLVLLVFLLLMQIKKTRKTKRMSIRETKRQGKTVVVYSIPNISFRHLLYIQIKYTRHEDMLLISKNSLRFFFRHN